MLARQFMTIAIAVSILLWDAPRLIRTRLWGELWTHAALTLTAAVLVLLTTFNVQVPPLLKWLVMITKPWGQALFGQWD